MLEYRICVNKSKNGTATYIPQYRTISKYLQWLFPWEQVNSPILSSTYKTCIDAQIGIDYHKKALKYKDDKKVVDVRYIKDNECNL